MALPKCGHPLVKVLRLVPRMLRRNEGILAGPMDRGNDGTLTGSRIAQIRASEDILTGGPD